MQWNEAALSSTIFGGVKLQELLSISEHKASFNFSRSKALTSEMMSTQPELQDQIQ